MRWRKRSSGCSSAATERPRSSESRPERIPWVRAGKSVAPPYRRRLARQGVPHLPVLTPLLEEPFPEGTASAEVRVQLLPVARHELRRREDPHVRVSRLAQDLAEQPEALGVRRRPQKLLDLAHGEGVVPREVRDDLRIRHVGAEEACSGHDGDPTTRRGKRRERNCRHLIVQAQTAATFTLSAALAMIAATALGCDT